MEHHWSRKGVVLLAIGFLISPDGGKYVGYKLLPEYGNKNMRKKPRVELCNGMLHKRYTPSDGYITLRTKVPVSSDYKNNEAAAAAVNAIFNKKLLDGWTVVKPAYPSTLLGTAWINIRQVKLL